MKTKQIKTIITIENPKGDVKKGSVYNWNEDTGFYEYKQDGVVVSTVNENGVNFMKNVFKRI